MINLMQGDCLERMKEIEDNSVDLILTDPPYGTTACSWDTIIPLDLMWEQLKRIIKPNGVIALFGSEPFSSHLRISNLSQYKYDWVYVKSQPQGFLNANKQPLRNNECISVFYKKQCVYNPIKTKGTPYICKQGKSNKSTTADENITNGGFLTKNKGDRYPLSVMDKINQERGLHPTQKPVALMEYLIKTYTNEDELVLDFTMGSATTGVAAKLNKRNFIGIELDQEYFDIAKKRIDSINPMEKFL